MKDIKPYPCIQTEAPSDNEFKCTPDKDVNF